MELLKINASSATINITYIESTVAKLSTYIRIKFYNQCIQIHHNGWLLREKLETTYKNNL